MDSLQKHEGNGRHDGILIDTLLPISGPEHLHHHLLLIFWAAHANATPVTIIIVFVASLLCIIIIGCILDIGSYLV